MFIKKGFPFFWAIMCAFAFKVKKNGNKSKKKFSSQIQYGYQKTQKFHADFKSVEKIIKMYKKKLLAKTWRKYELFPLLLMFVKLVLLITFFGAFCKTFSTNLKSAWNSAFFDIFFNFFKFFFVVILVLFPNFEAKRAKNGVKNQKMY